MKKIIIRLFTAGALVAGLAACEDQLEDKYNNPEQTTEASLEKFFTRLLDNDRVRPAYWNVRTFLVLHPGLYTQTSSFINSNKRYQQQLSYTEQRWTDYFTTGGNGSGVVAHYREMQKAYNLLSEEDQANADVYMNAAKVVYLDQTLQMVDLWGDIPFSQAGALNLSGSVVAPKFDDAQDIYMTAIQGLEDAASYFANASIDPLTQTTFNKQDILLKGSLDKWRRYSNSLRLRALMRISFQNETKAQTDVMEMLNDPTQYPLISDASQEVLLQPLTTNTNDLRNALVEVSANLAPEFIVEEILKPSSDPRLRFLYDKGATTAGVPHADYKAIPTNATSAAQEDAISKGLYSVVDSSTFLNNSKFPGIVFTAAEVSFLKAEAFERWGSSASAEEAYKTGIQQSMTLYTTLNSAGATARGASAEDAITQGERDAMLATPLVAYTGTTDEKLEKIWTQKWLHLGFMQSTETWAEFRRTNFPAITFVPDNNTPGFEMPPTRLLYPASEKTYNSANYEAVKSEDTSTGKLFWDVD
jgi:hypothetical protein